MELLRWLKQTFIETDWRVDNTGGGDLSLSFITGAYETVGIVKKSVSTLTWFHAVAGGLTFGWPEDMCVGGAFSTTQMWDVGSIHRAPWCQPDLTLDDFRHGMVVVEVGANFVWFVGGAALTIVLFGMRLPLLAAVDLAKYFRYGHPSIGSTLRRCLPSGIMVLFGPTIGLPSVGIAGRVGLMYDRRYVGV